ncbi:MAG TPA: NUDIX hydrolase [Gammaproteobacteria bacterium]
MNKNLGIALSSAFLMGSIGAMADEAGDDTLLEGAWSDAQVRAIADKTLKVHLPLVRGALSEAERKAAVELLAAGERLHDVYLRQLHPQALAARDALARHPELAGHAALFRVMNGPIATTLDNDRVPFLGVDPQTPARNVYPRGATRAVLDAHFAAHPETRADLLSARSIVQSATPENIRRAIATLDAHPALDLLHPGLRARLAAAVGYMAVPYSVAYADDILFVYDRLNAAAELLDENDPAFARYLRLRGRDLLADDYDGGDAAWVTGRFSGNLNAQIGSYETYDDALYGVKTFFSFSLLQRDAARSAELAASIGDIQAIEDALPYESDRRVSSDLPVGVYNVMADFGQARGTNTASILPNESHLAQQFGRIILIRANILTHPQLFAVSERAFVAATVDEHRGDLTPEGGLYRTLWHEVGHYLGVNRARDGRELDVALQDTADLLEEMKADLVSLFAARQLHDRGAFDDARLHGIHADGIRRVLQKNRPRRDQPYQTMQLIQWNWFLDRGLLAVEGGRLRIRYERYDDAVSTLLAAVLELQAAGDRDRANEFVERWTSWDESLHGAVARRMRESETTRFALVRYEALGEAP